MALRLGLSFRVDGYDCLFEAQVVRSRLNRSNGKGTQPWFVILVVGGFTVAFEA